MHRMAVWAYRNQTRRWIDYVAGAKLLNSGKDTVASAKRQLWANRPLHNRRGQRSRLALLRRQKLPKREHGLVTTSPVARSRLRTEKRHRLAGSVARTHHVF